MIGSEYWKRQALALLNMSRATRDPAVAAELASKAADYKARGEGTVSPGDRGLRAPDVLADDGNREH
jgi:hypothetical protein